MRWDTKNLFLRDDKKRHEDLISVKGDKRVDLKAFRKQYGLRRLSFASAHDLLMIMRVNTRISDAAWPFEWYRLQSSFLPWCWVFSNVIWRHPNEGSAILWLNADELIRIIRHMVIASISLNKNGENFLRFIRVLGQTNKAFAPKFEWTLCLTDRWLTFQGFDD